jgi:hypothetical protein
MTCIDVNETLGFMIIKWVTWIVNKYGVKWKHRSDRALPCYMSLIMLLPDDVTAA